MKLKKFIPLGTAVLSALALVSVFFNYFTLVLPVGGDKSIPAIGENGALSFPDANPFYPDGINSAISTSAIFYLIAMILAAFVITIAILNFLGIGGKNMGYVFIGVTALCFIMALIATIIAFNDGAATVLGIKQKTGYELYPSLAPWWATVASFLALLSTGNVLLNNNGSKRKKK